MTATTVGFEIEGESQTARSLVREIWAARRLIFLLSRKDLFVRYRRASFGLLWSVGLPLIQAGVLAIVFSRVVRVNAGANLPTFMYSGIVPFTFFRETISSGTPSIVGGSDLATKVYFPRAVFPLVVTGTSAILLPANIGILLVLALGFHVHLVPIAILWLVPGVLLLLTFTGSLVLVLSALHVYFRDMQYFVQASLIAWIYVSPVIYPLRLAPQELRILLFVNPVTGVIELFRAAIVGADPGWLIAVASTVGWTILLFVAAVFLHRRFNRVFSDLM